MLKASMKPVLGNAETPKIPVASVGENEIRIWSARPSRDLLGTDEPDLLEAILGVLELLDRAAEQPCPLGPVETWSIVNAL